MIIDYIQLENFLSHSDTLIRFEKGINIIYGKNGAGKSSIVDAIRFALFGEKRGDRIAELVRSNTGGCSVTIGFRLNEQYFEVFRSMSLGKSGVTQRNSWIKREGMMIAETSEGVTEEIRSGLGIPKDTFLNSVFVRQGEMDTLISEKSSKREELFSKIIGIDVLSENAQKLKTIRDRLRLSEASFSGLGERLEKIDTEVEENKKQIEAEEKSLKTVENMEKEASEKLTEAESRKNLLLERKTKYDSILTRLKEIDEKLTGIKSGLELKRRKLESITFSQEEKENIEKNRLFRFRREASSYFRLMDQARAVEVELQGLEKSKKEFEQEKQKLAQMEESHTRYKEVEEKLGGMEDALRDLHNSRAVFLEIKKAVESSRLKIENTEKEVKSQQFSDLAGYGRETVSSEINSSENELRSLEGERRTLKERIGNMNRSLSDLRKNKETLGDNRKCPVCGTELDDSHLGEIHASYEEKEKELVEEIGSIAARVSELNSRYSKVEERLTKLRRPDTETFLAKSDEITRLKKTVSEDEIRMKDLEEKIRELSTSEEKNKALKAEFDNLKETENRYHSVKYALGKFDMEEVDSRLERKNKEQSELKSKLSDLASTMGFEPAAEEREQIDLLERNYDRIRSSENEFNAINLEMKNDASRVDELQLEKTAKGGELQSLEGVEDLLRDAGEAYDETRKSHSDLRQQTAMLTERIRSIRNLLGRLAEEKIAIGEDVEKLKKIKSAATVLEKIRGAFDRNGIQALIRKDSSVSINNMTRSYLSSFNFDFDDVRIDENFDIKVINNGVEEALDSLSGGERISLAIAVRLAIAKYLTGRVSTVIMDEPTNFLDEDRRNNLKDIIRYSLKDENMVQQMIMITHHSELTSAADLSLEVMKKNGISEVLQG